MPKEKLTAESDAVSYKLEAIDGGYELTIDADKDYGSQTEERVYPVYIDPTTSVNVSADAFVNERLSDDQL